MTDSLCQHLSNGSAAIVYLSNTEKFGRSTAASQYFLQMAGFLGIPVIAWNADNNGLEKVRGRRKRSARGGWGPLQVTCCFLLFLLYATHNKTSRVHSA